MCRKPTKPVNSEAVQAEQMHQTNNEKNNLTSSSKKPRNPRKRRNLSPPSVKPKTRKTAVKLVITKQDGIDIVVHYGKEGWLRIEEGKVLKRRYEIIKNIGLGGYANVYMAKDKKTGSTVAVKIARCGEKSNHFSKNEVKFMKATNGSSHIVGLIDNFSVRGTHGTHFVMVFEMMGPDLYSILKESNQMELTTDRIRMFCRDILKGMDQLHNKCGIIHFDLKSENILMTTGDEEPGQESYDIDLSDPSCHVSLKIGDLGQAAWSSEPVNRMVQNCTLRAPESFSRSQPGAPADMWSFGAIAYEMATGHMLFPCNHKKCRNEFNDISRLVAPMRALLSKEEIQKASRMNSHEAMMFSDFLLRIIRLKPERRMKVEEALEHPFVCID